MRFTPSIRNNKDETFDDEAMPSGIGTATRMMSGWGLKFFDYDNDGNLDLFLANGNPGRLDRVFAPRRDLSGASDALS